jgi:hypothetical protein
VAGFFGGDTDQLRDQSQACTQGARRLADLVTVLSSAIDGATWEGPDAEAFRARWHGAVKSDLVARGESVQHRARELEDHADEQDEVSTVDGGGFFDIIGDLLPGPPFGPLLPLPAFPGLPLGPGLLRGLEAALGNGTSASGLPGGAEFYGDPGYGTGNAASTDRPVGDADAGGSHWDGREIDNDLGYVDGYANTRASAGTNSTVDSYGNTTLTAGARAGAEIGFDEKINLPGGMTYQTDGRAGAEAYGEAGVTYGDGFSAGAAAGAGAYADISGTATGPFGESGTIGMRGYAGAEAHANVSSHATRNEDGNINGWTVGADAGAFAGAKGDADLAMTSPGGWLSASGSMGVSAGAGIGGSFGATASTDEVGFAVGGDVAAALGIDADLALSVHPNEIVNDITPGDYDVDDAISDVSGAFESASSSVGDAVSSINPFD